MMLGSDIYPLRSGRKVQRLAARSKTTDHHELLDVVDDDDESLKKPLRRRASPLTVVVDGLPTPAPGLVLDSAGSASTATTAQESMTAASLSSSAAAVTGDDDDLPHDGSWSIQSQSDDDLFASSGTTAATTTLTQTQTRSRLLAPAAMLRRRRRRWQRDSRNTTGFFHSKPSYNMGRYYYHHRQKPRRSWLIPAEHPLKVLWDVLTVVISFCSAYLTHVAIRDRQFSGSNFQRFCDCWFVMDILLNFVTEYKLHKHVTLTDPKAVWARYLTSWFVVDVLSLLPGEVLYVKPIIEQQNRRGFFKKSFFRTKAVIRVTTVLRQRHVKLFGQVARQSKRVGVGANRLIRLLIKYVPKYLLFLRSMKAVVAVRVLRQVHWCRKTLRHNLLLVILPSFLFRKKEQDQADDNDKDDDGDLSDDEGYYEHELDDTMEEADEDGDMLLLHEQDYEEGPSEEYEYSATAGEEWDYDWEFVDDDDGDPY